MGFDPTIKTRRPTSVRPATHGRGAAAPATSHSGNAT